MGESRAAPRLDRLDRHVWRSYLRIADGVSRYSVACSLEESLRLVNLPGEEEGRVYCFGRVALTGIAANANRQVWMDRLQQALAPLAAQAVHATDPRASSASSVYFNNELEALETLLRDALRFERRPEWFSASILGVPPESGAAVQIPVILERLRQPPISPGTAAAIVWAAIGTSDPTPFLDMLPAFLIRNWVREFDGRKNLSANATPIDFPGRLKSAVHQAARSFGWRDPRTIWLTSLAVISLSPSARASSTAVKAARSTLRLLEAAPSAALTRAQPADRTVPVSPGNLAFPASATRPLVFDDDDDHSAYHDDARRMPPAIAESETSNGPPVAPDVDLAASPAVLGESTQAAGLYFLLNVLRRLEISAALESCPALSEASFATHILKRLADHAGVVPGDPILLCLPPEQDEFSLSPEVLAALPQHASVWPAGFTPARRTDARSLLRIWALAVRRWCWRMGRLTVVEIVNRKGRVWLTRTDVDVTLPLASAEIRIRRIGLDIDPGWIPWFGKFGKVVRFHYRDRDPETPAC
jgi:hypothetical protein